MRRWLAQPGQVLRGPVADLPAGTAAPGVARLTGLTLACGLLYGGVMGSFGGFSGDRAWQVAVSGVKVPLLLLATFAVSLPSFFVLNTLAGVRSDFPAAVRALAGSQAGLTIVLASLAPYTALWYASSGSYRWALLFNALMFAVATFAAQGLLRRWYRPLVARDARHRWLLRAWLVLYSFVGVQMAWTLRPFVGEPSLPVQFFREGAWGNAYVYVAGMVWSALAR